jgi:hypothetical protein
MRYTLEHESELLKAFRETAPLNQHVIDRIQRSDFLYLKEAILAHYEINPFDRSLPQDEHLKHYDFTRFAEEADVFHLVDLFRRTLHAGEVSYVKEELHEPVLRTDYVKWATKRGLELPKCLSEDISPWEPPTLRTVEDAKKLPYDQMPLSVKACMHANLVANMTKQIKPKVTVSDVYHSRPVQTFLDLCAKLEGKDIKAEDTFRGYVEHQFKS